MEWNLPISIITTKIIGDYILDSGLDQQTCKVCGRPDKFDFNVPDGIWLSTVPKKFQTKVVCLACFDTFAHSRGIDYVQAIDTLYFTGKQAVFEFKKVWGRRTTC